MRLTGVAVLGALAASISAPAPANSETYEGYLTRLKEICAVECLKPRDLRRKARKQSKSNPSDLAVMMDVEYIRRVGDKYQLFNRDLERSNLETLAILGSAGIDVSGRSGAGGLPRSRGGQLTPDTVVIELDEQALSDLLNAVTAEPESVVKAKDGSSPEDADIVVEGEAEAKTAPNKIKPTMSALSGLLINRRIVVRGAPRLTPVWKGGRLDYRNKQVTLEVANVDDLVLLPRFDKEGEPVREDLDWLDKQSKKGAG
ncbi:MAG: hypothetical protein AAF251_10010 [Pseudomonadota bacterium]